MLNVSFRSTERQTPYLVDRLLPLGADRQAKDASRVLRMVDTVNQKSGEICRVVHVGVLGIFPSKVT
ncbi:hypothetical protein GQ627_0ndm00273 (plasmid) [Klebsiella pneumoniae]|nr:hypothetical protein GQ627_0ndm00273 [Klebsiella pneumoniae]